MVQFYAFSFTFNILGGLALMFDEKEESSAGMSRLKEMLNQKGVKFALGLACLIVGIFKILAPMGNLPVLGDLLPILTGLTLGCILLLDFFKSSSNISSEFIDNLDSLILQNKKYFGIIGLISGILHFLLPNVPIL